jgi:bifunctional DNase/RNase
VAVDDGAPSVVNDPNAIVYRVVELLDVSVTLPASHAMVQLSETESPYRTLAFPIALPEAAALELARTKGTGRRPGTHELFSESLARANVDVIALRILGVDEGVYLAELELMTQRGREVVSCRPSDGLILCLRQGVPAPVLVNEAVFDA